LLITLSLALDVYGTCDATTNDDDIVTLLVKSVVNAAPLLAFSVSALL
jgi:hypothetical protein